MILPLWIQRKLPRKYKEKNKIARTAKVVIPELRDKYSDVDRILISGWQKSGNTWFRFLILHLFEVANNGRTTPLTYDELNEIQKNELPTRRVRVPKPSYPFIFRTHMPVNAIYEAFKEVLMIHRNPLDTLVSLYHYSKNRDVPFKTHRFWVRKKLIDIDFYVLYMYKAWKREHLRLMDKATYEVSYERLHKDTFVEMKALCDHMNWEFSDDVIREAVRLSSFKSIKKMGVESGQQHGMAQELNGEFTRKGKVGAFYSELKPETIDFIINDFEPYQDRYGVYIDEKRLQMEMRG